MKRVAVDIGGTFTDLVAFDDELGELRTVKVLSTPREPWRGFLRALEELGWDPREVELIVHASTLGTNMFLGQVGLEPPKAVLVTNKGFRDILEIGRQNRPELYNLFFQRPPPLVPRSRRVEVGGRIGPRGEEIEPLDLEAVKSIARHWCGEARVFIVSFLHSYANPRHEEAAARVLREECPDAIVVTGSSVDPRPREYERTSTAVVNGLLAPLLRGYLERLQEELRARGFRGRLLLMQSSGGVAEPGEVVEKPAVFIESGPAAGAVAAAYFSRLLGDEKVVSFDMGGTTAKAAAILGGEPELVDEYEVGGRVHMGRVVRGTGYPVRHLFIDLAEVSAGGGTIAWIDPGGALRVGPLSAGADPGPACYGRGGEDPTVTDAQLVLGRLPDALAGGRLRLDRGAAERAVARIAEALGMELEEAAAAIIELANREMAHALRLVTVERGHDPRDFVIYAFGGAGPLHAAELAEELGAREVAVPPRPGVFSALGLLLTDLRYTRTAPVARPAEELSSEKLETIFERLAGEALERLAAAGAEPSQVRMARSLAARYRGQAYTLLVPYTGSLEDTLEQFHRLHEARYGFSLPGEPVYIESAWLVATASLEKPRLPRGEARPHTPSPASRRQVYFRRESWLEARVYRRERLRPGALIQGPAVIEEDESTILVPPGHEALVDEYYVARIRRISGNN